jgi:6-phosphogluconolactonase
LKGISNGIDWKKVFLFYVNHKCVPMTDASATHFKAKGLFLDAVGIPTSNVFSLAEGENLAAKGNMVCAGVNMSVLVDC